ncbi:hypothetical protein [Elioraea rosea]|uniref:hypothetical protein n=1 Tax=Elioraea rosea TaxID=2492390 RepID=UPI0011846A69|nr:hypothetical protein [Elioraea rosea]
MYDAHEMPAPAAPLFDDRPDGAGTPIWIGCNDRGGRILCWPAGYLGFETIYGFTPGRDTLSFGPGFFARVPASATGAALLRVCSGGGGRALLAANTAAMGWQFIAEFAGLCRTSLEAAIATGVILGGSPQPQPWNTL